MSAPHSNLVAVCLGQVLNIWTRLSFALMVAGGAYHHPFLWQCSHCLTFFKFCYSSFVVAWCNTKLKGESVGVLPDMGSMYLLFTEAAGV